MRVFSLPSRIEGIIFDIDKTLYDNEIYARHQIDVLIGRLAQELSLTFKEAQEKIRRCRADHEEREDNGCRSLGNIFAALGVSIETSVAWREDLIHPESFLKKDEFLVKTIEELSGLYRIMAVTNNPVIIGRETLAILGVDRFFQHVVGLDSTMKSKPNPDVFRFALETLDCDPRKAVSVGDRYEVDIEPALSIGLGGILVDGVTDVYSLPPLLALGL